VGRGGSGRGRRRPAQRGPPGGQAAAARRAPASPLLAMVGAGGGRAGRHAVVRWGGRSAAVLSSARLPRPPFHLQSGDLTFPLPTGDLPFLLPTGDSLHFLLHTTCLSCGGCPMATGAPPSPPPPRVAHPVHLLLHRRHRSAAHTRGRTRAKEAREKGDESIEMNKIKG
jgi:hypothetical protein